MASVTLEEVWLHLDSDPDTAVTAVLSGLTEQAARPVQVRRYAGGRLRAVTRPGVGRRLTVSLELAARADADQLRGWIGTMLMYRDPRGRLLWGVIDASTFTEIEGAGQDVVDVAFDLVEVTGTAEV